MVVAEREVQGSQSDFSFLKEMKGVKEALMGVDLRKLEGATPEDQKRIVEDALAKAGKEYKERQYGEKSKQVDQVLEAYQEGRLTLPGLLQGLELRPKPEASRNGGIFGRVKGFFKI